MRFDANTSISCKPHFWSLAFCLCVLGFANTTRAQPEHPKLADPIGSILGPETGPANPISFIQTTLMEIFDHETRQLVPGVQMVAWAPDSSSAQIRVDAASLANLIGGLQWFIYQSEEDSDTSLNLQLQADLQLVAGSSEQHQWMDLYIGLPEHRVVRSFSQIMARALLDQLTVIHQQLSGGESP